MPTRWNPLNRWSALAALLCALSGPIPAQSPAGFPNPFVARFSLNTQGTKIGEIEWLMEPVTADLYVYQSRTVTAGVLALVSDEEIIERSEWRFVQDLLQPLNYSYRRSGGKKNRNVEVAFDWEKRLAKNTAEGHSWRMPVPDGTLDKLSYVLVLMKDLAAEKTDLRYQIADGGRLKTYELRIEGEARIDTALGSLETVIIRRLRDSEERETLLWCAKNLGYLPVMIEHREKDGTLLMLIEQLEGMAF